MAAKTLYYDIKYLCNQSVRLNDGCLLDDQGAQARAFRKACGYMQIFMHVSFGLYALMSCYAKNLAGASCAFMEGNSDDCNREIDQSDCHDKQTV